MQKTIDRIRAAAEAVRAKIVSASQFALVAVISYVVFPPAAAVAFAIEAAQETGRAVSAVAGRTRVIVKDFYGLSHATLADVAREFRGIDPK